MPLNLQQQRNRICSDSASSPHGGFIHYLLGVPSYMCDGQPARSKEHMQDPRRLTWVRAATISSTSVCRPHVSAQQCRQLWCPERQLAITAHIHDDKWAFFSCGTPARLWLLLVVGCYLLSVGDASQITTPPLGLAALNHWCTAWFSRSELVGQSRLGRLGAPPVSWCRRTGLLERLRVAGRGRGGGTAP